METKTMRQSKTRQPLRRSCFDHELTTDEKEIAGTVVHYAVGATAGVVYGTAAELLPGITAGVGLPYGAAFWLAIDEGLVPLLGLSLRPLIRSRPTSTRSLHI